MATASKAISEDIRTEYPHIVHRPSVLGGRPRVEGTRLAVWLIARLWLQGETIETLLEMYPSLTPAAVHSALAYYWDHKGEIDAEIEANRPENVLAWLRSQPYLVEERPGVFRGTLPDERD